MPYIGRSTDGFGVRNRFIYLASSGDTSVSGADANGATLTFTDGAYVDVYLNGVLLKPTTDYNTSTANTIAGLSALNTNDEVTVIVYDVFTVADMVSATSGGTFSGNVTHSGTVTANSTLDMNGTELILDADADSSITADTDDEIHFKVAGDDHVKIKGGTNVLHVIEGSSGQGTPHTNSGVVIESDGETGINILTGNTNYGGIIFGDDGDNDIGFIQYKHDDNYIRFGTNTSEQMRIDSSGRVGIGVTDPTQYNSYGNGLIIEKSSTSGSSGMSIISGTSGYGSIYFNDGTGNNTVGRIEYYHGSGGMGFATEGSERMVLSSTGNLTVNATSASGTSMILDNESTNSPFGIAIRTPQVAMDNNSNYFISCNDSGNTRLLVYSDGDIVNHDNSYGSLSDERLKQDIVDSSSQWDDIKNLKIRNFKKKDDIEKYGEKAWSQIGVIAQELETTSPKLIRETAPTEGDVAIDSSFGTIVDDTDKPIYYKEADTIPDGKKVGDVKGYEKKVEEKSKVKAVMYSVLYMKAVKALQEAMTRIETLEAKVKTLEEA